MRLLLYITFCFACCFAGIAQSEDPKTKIEILNADALQFAGGDKNVRKLLGNVRVKQGSMLLHCDSAYIYSDVNDISAYSNVHIIQGDSMDIYADSLTYVAEEKKATLWSNVRLVSKKMNLTTNQLIYHTNTKVASYFSGAKIITEGTQLTSQIGYYYEESQIAYFKKDVKLKNPSYTLEADTLQYWMPGDQSRFFGPTNIVSDSAKIYCEGGWYNGSTDVAFFKKNAKFVNGSQIVSADSIHYEKKTGKGKAYSNVVWEDTVDHTVIYCGFADYDQKTQEMLATIQPVLVNVMDSDSMFIAADTLLSFTDSIKKYYTPEQFAKRDSLKIDSTDRDSTYTLKVRVLNAFHKVRLFKNDMQGVCDSLHYSEEDSTFEMFDNPILWVDGSQMTGDTILIKIKNQSIHRLDLLRSAFIVNKADSAMYNQIKGQKIFGFFKGDTLDKMDVVGNGESIYFAVDDSDAFLGVNKAICSKMIIYFGKQQVRRLTFLDKPDATFLPIQKVDLASLFLDGYAWHIDRKPKSSKELFTPVQPISQAAVVDPNNLETTSELPLDPQVPPEESESQKQKVP